MRRISLLLFLAIALVVAAAIWWLQDANRIKPEFEAYLTETLDMQVTIAGDLHWELWPPLTLTAADLVATDGATRYSVQSLSLHAELTDPWRPVDAWQVQSLTLRNVDYSEDAQPIANFDGIAIADFQPGEWAQLSAQGTYLGDPVRANGDILYKVLDGAESEETTAIALRDLQLNYMEYGANCAGDLARRAPQDDAAVDDAPLAALRHGTASISCALDDVTVDGLTISGATLSLDTTNGEGTTVVSIPDLFAGSAHLTLDHTTGADTVEWELQPQIDNIDTKAVQQWLQQPVTWQGQLQLTGRVTASGLTADQLQQTVLGRLNMNGGEGIVDIRRVKEQVQAAAQLTREADSVADWPDEWPYKHMVGTLGFDGKVQQLEFALDNLSVSSQGRYAWTEDRIDHNAEMVFGDDPAYSSFDVNPLLVGLPIPLDCEGPLAEIRCEIDRSEALKSVARAARRGENTAIREKLEEKIDEEVPEAYRDAARALLDILTGSQPETGDERD